MGLFNRKKEDKKFGDVLKLPELPKLPDMEDEPRKEIHQLPKFPNSSLGQRFSQNIIKNAITGKKEEGVFANEFAEDEMQMMRGPQLRMPLPPREKLSVEIPTEYEPRRTKETVQPVFIRIDKFEEGMDALEEARKQVMEIEKILGDIKKVKEEEEKEISSWEKEIQVAKEQIEKIDKGIFSKLE